MVAVQGIDVQPVLDSAIGWYTFAVIFIFIGSFLSLGLFVAVISDNFLALRRKVSRRPLVMNIQEHFS